MRIKIQMGGEAQIVGGASYPFTLTLSEYVEAEPPPELKAEFAHAIGVAAASFLREFERVGVGDPRVVARDEAGNVTFEGPLSEWSAAAGRA